MVEKIEKTKLEMSANSLYVELRSPDMTEYVALSANANDLLELDAIEIRASGEDVCCATCFEVQLPQLRLLQLAIDLIIEAASRRG